MKVLVKTLKGTHFEIEVKLQDTVYDVKKNIETVQGSDVYPSAQQMLIHQGKVLKDGTTMEENKVSENSFMVIMLSKNKISSAPPPTPAAAAPPQPPSSAIIHRILAIGGGAWDRDAVVRALAAAFNNPQRAVQYLYSTIPAGAPPPTAVNPPQATRTPPPAPPTGSPNANSLSLFHHRLPAGAGGNLDFLLNSPQFQDFRSRVQSNPQILPPILEELWRRNPRLAGLLHDHRSDFLRMIFEPVEHREVSEFESFIMTHENMEALNRLEAMGFKGSVVWSVFVACDKNEELAANYLLDHMHEFEE